MRPPRPPTPPATAAEDAPRASSYSTGSVTLAGDPAASTSAAVARTGVEPAGGLETAKKTRPVAPGISLTSFDRYDELGWLRADAVTADLGAAKADYVYSGEVSKTEPLSGPAKRPTPSPPSTATSSTSTAPAPPWASASRTARSSSRPPPAMTRPSRSPATGSGG